MILLITVSDSGVWCDGPGLTLKVLELANKLRAGRWEFVHREGVWHCGTLKHGTLVGLMEGMVS